jgi:hypothetical protein
MDECETLTCSVAASQSRLQHSMMFKSGKEKGMDTERTATATAFVSVMPYNWILRKTR